MWADGTEETDITEGMEGMDGTEITDGSEVQFLGWGWGWRLPFYGSPDKRWGQIIVKS